MKRPATQRYHTEDIRRTPSPLKITAAHTVKTRRQGKSASVPVTTRNKFMECPLSPIDVSQNVDMSVAVEENLLLTMRGKTQKFVK
ncbi:MAG: hypothetical protein V2I33_20040 [Kangiellaceae bacterium]|nr:hypothetical protein [Kangiellaceae bacterium]